MPTNANPHWDFTRTDAIIFGLAFTVLAILGVLSHVGLGPFAG